MSAFASRMSSTRSAPARACWVAITTQDRLRSTGTSWRRYEEKARYVPRLSRPSRASQPPNPSTMICPAAGTAPRVGTTRASIRVIRIRARNRRSDAARTRSISRSSAPKPFTMRTPAIASSAAPATSASRCWASQLDGCTLRRVHVIRTNITTPSRTTTVLSSGDSTTITTTATVASTRFPVSIGNRPRSCWMRLRSPVARDTIWPVCN